MADKERVLRQQIWQVDLDNIKGIDDLVDAYGESSIQARNIGACAKVFEQMLTDPDRPTIMLGLAYDYSF